jgi:hypothetical protein
MPGVRTPQSLVCQLRGPFRTALERRPDDGHPDADGDDAKAGVGVWEGAHVGATLRQIEPSIFLLQIGREAHLGRAFAELAA